MTPLHRGSTNNPRAQPISHAVSPHAPRRRHGPSILHIQFGPSANSQCMHVRVRVRVAQRIDSAQELASAGLCVAMWVCGLFRAGPREEKPMV
jgi:hypothetical protein